MWAFQDLKLTLTDHSRGPPAHVHGLHRVLYTLHLLFVATSLAGSVLLCLFQGCLQGFDPLSCSSQSLFHFGNFTPEVGIIPQQLWSRTWTWTVGRTLVMEHGSVNTGFLPACELFQAVPGCSPESWSSVSGCCSPLRSPSPCESSAKTTQAHVHIRFTSTFIYHLITGEVSCTQVNSSVLQYFYFLQS